MTVLAPLNGLCADGSEPYKQINSNVTNCKNIFNSIIPYQEQSLELRGLVSSFLNDYKAYQIKYFKVAGQLPDVIGPDAIGQIDAILLKNGGIDTFGLKDLLQTLTNKLDKDIFPKMVIEVVGLWEKEGIDVNELKSKLTAADTDKKLQILADFIRTNLPIGNDHDVDYGSRENLSIRLNQSIRELNTYEKEINAVNAFLLQEEEKFSKETKAYINSVGDKTDIENKGGTFKRYKKLYLIDEIGQMALIEKDRLTLEAAIESIKTNKQGVEGIQRDIDTFSQDEIIDAHNAIDYIKGNYSSYDMFNKGPNVLLAEGGGCINMYIALIARDIFHAVTDGRFVAPSKRRDYQKYKYENWDEKASHLFKKYFTVEGATAMGSFVVVSNVINTKLPTTMVMRNLFGWSDKILYGAGGKLVRGVSLFGLSMGIGQKISEVIATGIMWRHELTPSWKGQDVKVIPLILPGGTTPVFIPFNKMNELAWDLFISSNFSPQAWEEVTQFIVSFGLADIMLDGRIYVGFYNKMKGLNKKKCSYTFADIMERILQKRELDGKWYSPGYKPSLHPASLTRSLIVFLTADRIDDYFVSKFLFPSATKEQEELLMTKSGAVAQKEFNVFTDDILQTKPTREQLDSIYDMYGGWVFLKDIIPVLRENYYAVESCLDLRDNKENIRAKKCFDNLYSKYFQDMGNTIANLNVEHDYMQTPEYKNEKYEEALKVYGKATVNKLRQDQMLKNNLNPAAIAKGKIAVDEIIGGETRIMAYIKDGRSEDAKTEMKRYLSGLKLSDLEPLFSSVVTESWSSNKKPSMVLNENVKIPSETANQYLQKMIYLFTDIYPKMLDTKVTNKDGIEIVQNGFRRDILIAIAKGLYKKMKENCSETELDSAKDILNYVKIEITDQSNSIEVISTLNKTYPELGLLKEINNSMPPKK